MPLHLAGGGDIRKTVLDYLITDDGTQTAPNGYRSTFQERLCWRAGYWREQHTGVPPPSGWEFPPKYVENARDANPPFNFDRIDFECDADSDSERLESMLLIP